MRIGCGFGDAESITTSTASVACWVDDETPVPVEVDASVGAVDEGRRVRWLNKNGRLWSLQQEASRGHQ
jgi:hypothetical protein